MTADRARLRRRIEDVLREAGLAQVGFAGVEPFTEVRVGLEQRRARGQHAGMSFTFSDPRRSTEPARLLRRARTMIVGAWNYAESTPPRPPGSTARVARYAWKDHYADLRAALEGGAAVLREAGHRAMVISDQNGLVDRAAAHRAGIGWWGRNTNLLIPGAGSWFVLGSIITDADLPHDEATVEDGCKTCTRCISACPTGAIVDEHVLDARRCLAWLVQQKGMFPRAHRVALGDRIYGCDDCQEKCPPGRSRVDGATPVSIGSEPRDAWVDVIELLHASDEQLLERFGRWYIPQRDPRYLRRNALVVLGNVGDPAEQQVREALDRAIGDADPIIRAHAVWACARLGLHDRVASLADDPSPAVRAEVALAPTVEPAPTSLGAVGVGA